MDTCDACGQAPQPSRYIRYRRPAADPCVRLHDHVVEGQVVGRLCLTCRKLAGHGERIVRLGEYLAARTPSRTV